jgi:hypothetical protein
MLPPSLLLLALAGCGDDAATDTGPPPEPGELMAGVARARIPAPVGIGTAGFGFFGAPSSESPFANYYPATTSLHGHPELKVVVISRGETFETVFVRVDAVGMFQQLRRAIVLELEDRLGRPMDDALIIGATHTHSGPGRIIDGGGLFDLIADSFFPDFYEALVDAVADAVEAAYADLEPARVGVATAYSADGHSDRRCEDGLDYTNDTIPLLAVERGGEIDALIMAYAVHGTVLGIDELTLSQDVSGAIEQAVEDRFDHPVQVQMFNSWGADMSPGSPSLELQEGVTDRPDGYDRMEEVGEAVATDVSAALGDFVWWDEPVISASTHRAFIDRDYIGYDDETFENFEYGGVYCESDEADCDPATTIEGLDDVCLGFTEEYPAPNQTVFTAGQIGELYFVTFPGEPGTLLAEGVLAEISAAHPEVGQVMFLGYTQDYLGYSILEDDWWQGGYEASGALWGPRQGEYLSGEAVSAFGCYMGTVSGLTQPAPIATFDVDDYTPYAPITAVDPGAIAQDVAASYGPTETVALVVQGSDPWLGAPLAHLETADGQPVLRPGGISVDSDDYNFHWALTVDPEYGDDASQRTFYWALSMPARRTTPGGLVLEPGDYRLRVEIPTESGGTEAVSGTFSIAG